MERTKMVFGNENPSMPTSNFSRLKIKVNNNNNNNNNSSNLSNNTNTSTGNISTQANANSTSNSSSTDSLKGLLELLKSNSASINKSDLINALKYSTRSDINTAISTILGNDPNESSLPLNSSNSSLISLVSNTANNASSSNSGQVQDQLNDTLVDDMSVSSNSNANSAVQKFNLGPSAAEAVVNENSAYMNKLSENFDEFEDSQSDNQSIQKQGMNELDAEYEGDDEV
jgi:hypothetical protein